MSQPFKFWYKNYRGEISERSVIPFEVYYGQTEWHPHDQWLMKATDLEKGEERIFAMSDILGSLSLHSQDLENAFNEGYDSGHDVGSSQGRENSGGWQKSETFAKLQCLDPTLKP